MISVNVGYAKNTCKIWFYLKESIFNNQGRLENENSRIKIKILFINRLGSKPWSSFTLRTLELCQWRYFRTFNLF